MTAGISVVVPTRDSNDTVPALLLSLDRARAELPGHSEVIVVDDSGPANRAELERLCALHDARLVDGVRHVAGKRNQGVAAARFDVVLFVDSDCEASPGLLREHRLAHDSGADACAGPVEFVGPRSWLWAAMDLLGVPVTFALPAVRSRLPWSPTANLSVARRCLEEVGGFDETLPSPGGSEDVDLGLRLTGRGIAIHGCRQALVWHSASTWNSLPDMLMRMARYGRTEPRLAERHPGRSRTVFPGHLALSAMGAATWLAVGLVHGGALGPLLAPLWLAAYWIVWTARILQFGWPEPGVLVALLASALLDMAHEAGRLAGAWACRRPRLMLSRLIGSEEQPRGEWTGGSARAWSWSLATLVGAVVWLATAP